MADTVKAVRNEETNTLSYESRSALFHTMEFSQPSTSSNQNAASSQRPRTQLQLDSIARDSEVLASSPAEPILLPPRKKKDGSQYVEKRKNPPPEAVLPDNARKIADNKAGALAGRDHVREVFRHQDAFQYSIHTTPSTSTVPKFQIGLDFNRNAQWCKQQAQAFESDVVSLMGVNQDGHVAKAAPSQLLEGYVCSVMTESKDPKAKLYAYSFINMARELDDSDSNMHRCVLHNISGAVCWAPYQEQAKTLTKKGLVPASSGARHGVPDEKLEFIKTYIKKRQVRAYCLWLLVKYLVWIAVFLFTDADIKRFCNNLSVSRIAYLCSHFTMQDSSIPKDLSLHMVVHFMGDEELDGDLHFGKDAVPATYVYDICGKLRSTLNLDESLVDFSEGKVQELMAGLSCAWLET
ncbi:hypothetical protein OPT61_g8830 [Boeremia exigua]|uniref:Uncharacterized protein n=1 Tax=Boeremia exigua TaxID=749465 RepID=A0ACC2HWM0_9PLEO|nr:hypothetical protein OPT61_g8830 [Boeremia exigua]